MTAFPPAQAHMTPTERRQDNLRRLEALEARLAPAKADYDALAKIANDAQNKSWEAYRQWETISEEAQEIRERIRVDLGRTDTDVPEPVFHEAPSRRKS